MTGVGPLVFRFKLGRETQEKIEALKAEAEALSVQFASLDASQAHLLQPFLERFLGMLGGLGDDLLLVEGNVEVEAARACKAGTFREVF